MKITKIQIEKNFTKFKNNELLVFDNSKSNSTFIYGVNGTGKSSLSRLFYYSSLQINNIPTYKEKLEQLKTIGSTENSLVRINYDDETETIITNNEITNPIKISVFNRDYIDDKITYQQNFRNNKFDATNSTYSITSDAKNNYIAKKIYLDKIIEDGKQLKIQIEEKIKNEITQTIADCATTRNNTIFNEYTYELIKNINDDDIDDHIDKLRLEHIQFIQNLKDLNENDKADFNIPMLNDKSDFISYINNINLNIKFSEDKSKTNFAKEYLDGFLEDEKKWKLEGDKYIKNNNCPFCGADISNNSIIKYYKVYLDSKVKETEDFLKKTIDDVKAIDASLSQDFKNLKIKISNIDKIFKENNLEKANDFITQFHDLLIEIQKICELKLEGDNLYNDCSESIKNIDNKQIEKILQDYSNVSNVILQMNKKVDDSSKAKKNKNDSYLKSTAKHIIYKKIKDDINALSLLQKEFLKENEILNKYKKLYEEDIKNKNELLKLMNKYLDDFKITNYRINEEFDLCINNIPITYEANKYLSEGEKSVIAFALFMAEIKLLYSQNEKEIIFIDDPITSMDYPNIYNIYNYIYDLIKENKESQIILTSHNIKFLNMFKFNFKNSQYIILSENENGKTVILKDDNKLSSNYLEKLKDIYKIHRENAITEKQKLYIHNYCRYVFETLSRFEYPNHKDESTSSRAYIDALLQKISDGKLEYSISNNKLKALCNIINKGSHATIDIVHDDEEYDDSDYIDCCHAIIKYLNIAYVGQYDYLSTNYSNNS